jgi:hypothetical protein
MNHLMIPRASNSTVFCVHAPIKLKVCLITEYDLLRKIGAQFLVFQQAVNKFSAMYMVWWLEVLMSVESCKHGDVYLL